VLVSEVINFAENLSDEEYDNTEWFEFINACLDELTPLAKILKTKSGVSVTLTGGNGNIVISSDTDLAKAHEFVNVFFTPSGGGEVQLRKLNFADNYAKGWKETSDRIYYQNCGSVNGTSRIDYYQKLQHISTVTEDIETVSGFPSQYHILIVNYCAAKAKQREEDLDERNNLYGEYIAGKKQLAIERVRIMEPHNLPRMEAIFNGLFGGA
jgi:hypothetical protein